MQVTISPATERGQVFTLTAETDADRELIDAIDLEGTQVLVRQITQRALASDGIGFVNTGVILLVDRHHPQALEAKTARQLLSSFRDLCRLGLAEAAYHRHVGPNTADPEAHKELSASLEQLQLMLQTLGEVVLQQRAVLQEMHCAHKTSYGEKGIVAQQGGAA